MGSRPAGCVHARPFPYPARRRDHNIPAMPLFIDIASLSTAATDDALEFIFKSTHDRDDGIWAPHDSVLIRRLVELFTRRGLDRLDHVQKEILAWQAGHKHQPTTQPVAKPGMMERWTEAELSLVKLYLESLPPAQWSLDDHMMAVDYVVQRYLPADELRTEAEWLATRAGLMGKVQANIAAEPTPSQADKILAALPSSVAAATEAFALTAAQQQVLSFGAMRCAENVRALTEELRHKMRATIMHHAEEVMTGAPGESLQTRLLDQFGQLNRDWRRIAVTEAGNCQLNGYIASLKPGTKVKRVEQYKNACSFCRRIHGRIMEVVSPDARYKDGDTQIWPGKSNVGRSASPRKRVGDVLVPREAHELYWVPAGTAHPHCRGRWVPVVEDELGDDPEFAEWLRSTLG